MVNFIQWVLGLALTIGIGSALVECTYELAKAAAKAHQHDQMSYSKFTRALVDSKPRQRNK